MEEPAFQRSASLVFFGAALAEHSSIHVFGKRWEVRQAAKLKGSGTWLSGLTSRRTSLHSDVRLDRVHMLPIDDLGCPNAPCRALDVREMMLGRITNDVKAYTTST